jgi:ABC-type tungstate transport system substrate-binding protein
MLIRKAFKVGHYPSVIVVGLLIYELIAIQHPVGILLMFFISSKPLLANEEQVNDCHGR